jgi:hypothetical protein
LLCARVDQPFGLAHTAPGYTVATDETMEGPVRKIVFAAGAAVGYILGTRAGRQRYEQIAGAARQVASQPTVKQALTEVQSQATRAYDAAKTAVTERVGAMKSTNNGPMTDGMTKTLPVDDQTTVRTSAL